MKFKSKLLLKKAWEDERFSYFGMQFAIDKAEQLIAAHPRKPQPASKAFLKGFVGTVEDDEREERESSFNLLQNRVDKEHVKTVDENKPGIVAQIIFKEDKKRNQPQKTYGILIDGNHRAKKRLKMGLDFMDVYVLTPEETWQVMAPYTSPFLLKDKVNPIKKAPKPKAIKPNKVDAMADIQARLDFIKQNPDQYLENFGEPLWMDDLGEERAYLESQLKKKRV